MTSATATRLKSFVDRIEALDDERREIGRSIAEVFKEAKAEGFDTKALREVLRVRRIPPMERAAREELRALYLGQLDGTPLGEWTRAAA